MEEYTDLIERLRKEKETSEDTDYKQGYEAGRAEAQQSSYEDFLYCEKHRGAPHFVLPEDVTDALDDLEEYEQPSNYDIYALGWRDGMLSVWDNIKHLL